MDQTQELLEELSFGPAQGRRELAQQARVVRELEQRDLALIEKPAKAAPTALTRIRNSHHALAQGVAQGLELGAISLSTGYDPAYISKLKADPAFAELVAFYAAQQEQIFVDVMQRMRTLGLSVVDELQAEFDENPGKFSAREKMELVDLMLVRSGHVGRAAQPAGVAPGAAPFALSINFVAPSNGGEPKLVQGQVLEGEKV